MKSYIIEDQNRNIVNWSKTLEDAKRIAETSINGFEENPIRYITMMIGHQFGEGFHQYTLELRNGKYKYVWKK